MILTPTLSVFYSFPAGYYLALYGSLSDPETLQNCSLVISAKHGLFLLNYADSEREVNVLLLICSFYAEFYLRKQNRYKSRDTNSCKKECCMLPLKIFWLDMDKYPGDTAKIIDQSESFLLCGRVRTSQSRKNMNC